MSNKTKFLLFLFVLWFGSIGSIVNADETTFESGVRTPRKVTQAEAEAGTGTSILSWTPERIKQAINAVGVPYPGTGIPQSTGSGWGTSITPGTGVALALANDINGTGGFLVTGNAAVTNSLLTGFVSGAGAIGAGDSILAAFQKLDGNVGGKAATGQTFYFGTTQIAINRGSAVLPVAGVSLDNASGQFYDTSAPTKKIQIDPSNQTPGNTGIIRAPDGGTAVLVAGTMGVANADTTGSAGFLKSTATTGKITISGPAAASTRAWSVPDADVTIPSGTLAVVSGALGTPSFTALNIPSSNADPETTAGQIKHDSTDTGSNSGGTAKWYDGTQVRSIVDTGTNYTIITKTEYFPIRYAEDGTTAPAAVAEVGTTTAVARSFTEGDDVVFWWVVPNDYVGGVKYRVIYALSANAQANETVVFSMTGCTVAHSGALACAAGTALTVTQELTTDEDTSEAMITGYSAESNADWSIVVGSITRLAFSNAAAGDYTGEPLVIGVEVKYKAKVMGIGDY